MVSSRPNIRVQLQDLQNRRQALLNTMMDAEQMIIGSVYDVLRRCGNASCHCAEKPAHRQTLLIFVKKGKRVCKFVRQEDAEWVREAWKRYRGFKKDLRTIRALQKRELKLLGAQMRQHRISYE